MTQPQFALATATHAGRTFPCVVRDGYVWEVSRLPGLSGMPSTLALLDDWGRAERALWDAMETAARADAIPLDEVRLEAPVRPRQIFCTGANYKKHVAELAAKQADPASEGLSGEERASRVRAMMEERARTGTPYAFVKLPSAITGPFDEIVIPSGSSETDWELELAVVIGRSVRNVSRSEALSAVAGYAVANDVTARDLVYRSDLKAIGTDWLSSKCRASFLPLGPWIVPARFVPDPQRLHITLRLNGETMQDESTADMIFDVARQIEYVSSLVRLFPGDIICTGSPAGNGTHYQRFLRPGDVVEGTISGLGTQRLTCVAEAPADGAGRRVDCV